MNEHNRKVLELRQTRHEGMIHATMGMAVLGVVVGMIALWRTL